MNMREARFAEIDTQLFPPTIPLCALFVDILKHTRPRNFLCLKPCTENELPPGSRLISSRISLSTFCIPVLIRKRTKLFIMISTIYLHQVTYPYPDQYCKEGSQWGLSSRRAFDLRGWIRGKEYSSTFGTDKCIYFFDFHGLSICELNQFAQYVCSKNCMNILKLGALFC